MEKDRFVRFPHEWLLKRFIEIPYNVKSDDKIISNFKNTSLCTIFLKSPKKLKYVKIDGYNLIDQNEDPESYYNKSENYYFYYLDHTKLSVYQPSSHYILNESNPITIDHDYDEEIPITITYVLYDFKRKSPTHPSCA